jgi:hypothetical protein
MRRDDRLEGRPPPGHLHCSAARQQPGQSFCALLGHRARRRVPARRAPLGGLPQSVGSLLRMAARGDESRLRAIFDKGPMELL